MENKKKRNKAIIISLLVLITLILILFLVYKNKDSFGVKTSSVLTRIFSPLETSDNKKKELVLAEEYINAGDSVTETGGDSGTGENIRKVKRGTSNAIGKAIGNIEPGKIGEIELFDTEGNSFWNSFSQFLSNGFSFKQACSDGKDNDGDGLIDVEDPNCHEGGDLSKEYLPKHFSESVSPYDPNLACSDGKDNDGDGLIDVEDPNCHEGGDLSKEYLPKHFSESVSPYDPNLGIDGIDLIASIVYPISAPVNTEIELSSDIKNRGNDNSGQEINVLFTISSTKEGDSDKNTDLLTTIPQINSQETGIATVKNTFSSTGSYYIRACADKKSTSDEGSVTEAFEDNNCSGWTTFSVTNVLPGTGKRPECSDEKDNDGDELVDAKDPNCHKDGDLNAEYLPEYNSESRTSTECSDTLDNDNDTLIDEKDPVCHEGGDLNKKYLPNYNSESVLSYVCNDTIDNDGDSYIDALDPNCHEDGSLNKPYKATHDSESESPEGPNKCLDIEQNPITFTDEEQKQLDELLRKFYLISPNLKSEMDIGLIYDEINNQQNFINQIDVMIDECYTQISDPAYTGPKEQYGNPWYNYNNRGSYVKQDTSSSTSYCASDSSKPALIDFDRRICSRLKTREACEGLNPSFNFFSGFGYYKKTNCKWVDTMNLEEYETLLNIW